MPIQCQYYFGESTFGAFFSKTDLRLLPFQKKGLDTVYSPRSWLRDRRERASQSFSQRFPPPPASVCQGSTRQVGFMTPEEQRGGGTIRPPDLLGSPETIAFNHAFPATGDINVPMPNFPLRTSYAVLNIRSTSNPLHHTSSFGPFSAALTPIFVSNSM